MSSRLTVFVGPYLRCLNSQKKGTRRERRCVRCENQVRVDSFCSSCGGAVDYVPVEVLVDGVDVGKMQGQMECSLQLLTHQGGRSVEGVDFWVTNLVGGPGHFYSRDRDMNPETVPVAELEVKEFRKKFEKEIIQMTAAYGMEWVAVCWGVLTEWD